MARSGETLMLKMLATHDNVKVVHNLDKNDDEAKERAFQFFKSYSKNKISRKHPLLKTYSLKKNDVLLLKQGVWKHRYSFNGFILSRNPVSIYASLKAYDKNEKGYDEESNFWFGNEVRLSRWLKDIDESYVDLIKGKKPEEQFVIFYNLRMGNLLKTGLPFINYEKLITETETILVDVCRFLNIDFNKNLLESHKYYEKGLIGHGQNDLSKPIDTSSLYKYKSNVTEEEFNFISEMTKEVHSKYGYSIKSNEIVVL